MRRILEPLPLLAALTACTGAVTTTGFTPVTSIVVRAESVISPGQCGKAPTQFAKYTAVITSIVTDPDAGKIASALGGQTSPCYADAMFANLPPAATNLSFRIDVFLWSADAYAAVPNIASIEARLRDVNPQVVGAALAELANLAPKRVCTAFEISNVQAVARCDPPIAVSKDCPKKQIRFTDAGTDASKDAGDSGIADAGSD